MGLVLEENQDAKPANSLWGKTCLRYNTNTNQDSNLPTHADDSGLLGKTALPLRKEITTVAAQNQGDKRLRS